MPFQQIFLGRPSDRRSIRFPSLAIDLVNNLVVEFEFGRGLFKGRAGGKLVFDLIVQIEDRARCAVLEDLFFEIGLGFVVSWDFARLDFDHPGSKQRCQVFP